MGVKVNVDGYANLGLVDAATKLRIAKSLIAEVGEYLACRPEGTAENVNGMNLLETADMIEGISWDMHEKAVNIVMD